MYLTFHKRMRTSIPSAFRPLDARLPPFDLYRLLHDRYRTSFILESAVGESRTVAYSFLGAQPECVLRCRDGKVEGGEGLDHLREAPIDFLRAFMDERLQDDQSFPFLGGLVGYFSYEFASLTESSFIGRRHARFPVFELGYYPSGIVYDHSTFRAYQLGDDGGLAELIEGGLPDSETNMTVGRCRHHCSQEEYESAVELAKGRILEGEAFQVVLSRGVEHAFDGDPLALYALLRTINPSPYMFHLDFGERQVLGSSPETLVSLQRGQVTTFPIAGTRPRGSCAREQRRLREEMLMDEKERAEHCMLVDLARNDLNKVCELDSVHVPEFMRVDAFSHVQHIVSKVQGSLAPGKGAVEVLAAVFPAGTVSGAPKPRAMEIIAELEGRARGPYAGGVGYLSLNGNMDSAIAIRSAFCAEGRLLLQAGAGIVADSDPHREYLETEHKLGALQSVLSALEAGA